jgi:hypothetical protein
MSEQVLIASPKEVNNELFFSVSTFKLITLSTFTFGLYEVYWFYKNWVVIEKREDLSPFLRSVFSIIFCYSLFKRILLSVKLKGFHDFSSVGLLTFLYVILHIMGRLSGREYFYDAFPVVSNIFFLTSIFTFYPLLEVQKMINFNNRVIDVEYEPEAKFSIFEKILFVVGGILFIFAILGVIFG